MNADALMDLLLDDKDATISGLRNELDDVKASERKLWVVVARLQQAVGEANGWVGAGKIPADVGDFGGNLDRVDELLDEIVSLTPDE